MSYLPADSILRRISLRYTKTNVLIRVYFGSHENFSFIKYIVLIYIVNVQCVERVFANITLKHLQLEITLLTFSKGLSYEEGIVVDPKYASIFGSSNSFLFEYLKNIF